MSGFFRRTKPDLRDDLAAGLLAAGLAAGVAAVSFYLARLFLARKPLEPLATAPPKEVALPPPDSAAVLSRKEDHG